MPAEIFARGFLSCDVWFKTNEYQRCTGFTGKGRSLAAIAASPLLSLSFLIAFTSSYSTPSFILAREHRSGFHSGIMGCFDNPKSSGPVPDLTSTSALSCHHSLETWEESDHIESSVTNAHIQQERYSRGAPIGRGGSSEVLKVRRNKDGALFAGKWSGNHVKLMKEAGILQHLKHVSSSGPPRNHLSCWPRSHMAIPTASYLEVRGLGDLDKGRSSLPRERASHHRALHTRHAPSADRRDDHLPPTGADTTYHVPGVLWTRISPRPRPRPHRHQAAQHLPPSAGTARRCHWRPHRHPERV